MVQLQNFDEFKASKTENPGVEYKVLGSTEELWMTLNPDTNMRFEIPMLQFSDPDYKMKYIKYMKLRKENPTEFERVLKWN